MKYIGLMENMIGKKYCNKGQNYHKELSQVYISVFVCVLYSICGVCVTVDHCSII